MAQWQWRGGDVLGVPEATPEGHLKALGAPGEDRAPGSGEGLGKGRAPKADVTCFPFFTLSVT